MVCHNPEQARRDETVRAQLVAHLESLIVRSDSWTGHRRDKFIGSLKTTPGLRRFLRRTNGGPLRLDAAAIKAESHLRQVAAPHLRFHPDPEDLAAANRKVLQVVAGAT